MPGSAKSSSAPSIPASWAPQSEHCHLGIVQQRRGKQRGPYPGAIALEVQIDGAILRIRMTNISCSEQFEKVKKHIDQINTADIRRLMAETIRERRRLQLKGGLHLMRLALENKSRISADYHDPFLTVESEICLGGLL